MTAWVRERTPNLRRITVTCAFTVASPTPSLTEWIYRPVAYITPSAIPVVLIAPVAAFWVAALRVLFFMVLYQFGLTPRPQVGG